MSKSKLVSICLMYFLLLATPTLCQEVGRLKIHVSVTDEQGRYITNLKKEDFQVTLDDSTVSIVGFSDKKEPATIGFLLDTSGSMADTTQRKGEAVALVRLFARGIENFVNNADPENEYFVMAFGEKVDLVSDLSQDLTKLKLGLMQVFERKPKGNTAFFSAVEQGVKKISKGKHSKKVLIALTDGQDNLSRNREGDTKSLLRKNSLVFYGVSLFDDGFSFLGGLQLDGGNWLQELSTITGGRAFFASTELAATDRMDRVSLEMNSHYNIEFEYLGGKADKADKYREIKVKLNSRTVFEKINSGKKIKLFVRAPKGFYPSMAN